MNEIRHSLPPHVHPKHRRMYPINNCTFTFSLSHLVCVGVLHACETSPIYLIRGRIAYNVQVVGNLVFFLGDYRRKSNHHD